MHILPDIHQFVSSGAETDFLGMCETGPVFGIRIGVVEMVVAVMEIRSGHLIGQLASRKRRLPEAGIDTGLVEGQRIIRGEHPHVRYDGGIVARMAVAGRRDIAYQGYVETRPPVHHGLGILGHPAVQLLDSRILGEIDGVEVAGAYTASAAYAVSRIYRHFPAGFVEHQPVVCAFPHASAASPAFFLVYDRLAVAVLLLLAGP